MTVSTWLLLSLTLFAGAASPGPSLALVVRSALNGGRKAGLLAAIAHGVGVWIYALAVVFGVAAVLIHVDWVMALIQLAGAGFLSYLGTMMIRAGRAATDSEFAKTSEQTPEQPFEKTPAKTPAKNRANTAAVHAASGAARLTYPQSRYISDGFLIVFFNPKIMFFFLAVFSQFLTLEQSLATQLGAATLAGIIDAVWYALVAVLVNVGKFGDLLQRYSGPIDVFFGVILWGICLTILGGLALGGL